MSDDEKTYGQRLAEEYDFRVYCNPCDRYVDFDPTNVKESSRPLGRRFRCIHCGEYGQCIKTPKWRNSLAGRIPYGST